MSYTAYGMLTPISEYNEKTIRKSLKSRNYSTEIILNSPVIIPEVSVAPSGESFRNTFFFCAWFSRFTVGTCRTRRNVTGAQEDRDRSRYAAYSFMGYSKSYKCSKCDNSMWKCPAWLERHELRCEAGVRHIYNGGVYHTTPSVFQRLDDEGITVADTLRFYPYRATFDFECFFDGENLPTDSDRVQWIARHVPLSVSVASNVPGHEDAQCYVTNGASDKLVEDMMRGLSAISDTAFDMLISSYDNVLNELEVRKEAWDEAERKAFKEDESKQDDDEEVEMGEVKINPYKTLIGQLLGWLHQLPVIGFNSGKYDLNVVKQFFVTYLLKRSKQDDNDDGEEEEDDEIRFVIKRQNTCMCFSTRKLRFLDIINFLAPGYSYDKYLRRMDASCRKATSHTSTWMVSGNWRIVLYLLRKRSKVDSRTNV